MKQVVLITGGSSGLGRVVAQRLADNDYQVVILAPEEEKLKRAAAEIGCDYVLGDVTNLNSVEKSVQEIIKKYNRLDVLINNAGVYLAGPIDENDPIRIERVYKINVIGLLWMIRAAAPVMKKQGGGTIINIGSQAGLRARANRSVYYSSKAAVISLTRCLQPELAPYGIKVSGLYPDLMKTSLFENAGVDKDMQHALDPMRAADAIAYILSQNKDNKDTLITELGIKHPQDF